MDHVPEHLRIVGRENGHHRTADGGWLTSTEAQIIEAQTPDPPEAETQEAAQHYEQLLAQGWDSQVAASIVDALFLNVSEWQELYGEVAR